MCRMLISKLRRDALKLPNRLGITLVGFADDATVMIKSDESIKVSKQVIEVHEEAIRVQFNSNKASIIGLGLWKNKTID